MSHSNERSEKVCLNCRAEIYGLYCHVCGQENREPKESIWALISHFFHDLTHFDGKFFSTLKYLIWKPGFLSREYLIGRRASYLNPVRMYVFTSAVFFIFFFAMFNAKTMGIADTQKRMQSDSVRLRIDSIMRANKRGISPKDSADVINWYKDNKDSLSTTYKNKGWGVRFSKYDFNSKKSYDSAQRLLPSAEKDSWLTKMFTYRTIELKSKYKENDSKLLSDLIDSFLHSFPYMLFVSLPLYALFLKLLYIRRKQFYYTDHTIFLLHLYIFTFIILLLFFSLGKLRDVMGVSDLEWLQAAFLIYGVIYTLRAMKKFYNQGWGKTIFKFILLNILALISLIFLFTAFFVLTIFRI
ncbi:MAG TPA: DUF3667 domain-containing protein [Flavitalea sp.]|nr:DUF3667 domain-containing protein [Flavitalea sp.]